MFGQLFDRVPPECPRHLWLRNRTEYTLVSIFMGTFVRERAHGSNFTLASSVCVSLNSWDAFLRLRSTGTNFGLSGFVG